MMLLALLREYWEQMAADFPRYYGFPLSKARENVTLLEFAAMAKHLPRGSATSLAINGHEAHEWDLSNQLLAQVANSVRWLQWSKSEDGQKNRRRPDPILPPWEENENKQVSTIGSEPMPLDELAEFIGWELIEG